MPADNVLEKPFRFVSDAAVVIPAVRKLVEQHRKLEEDRRALKAELERVKADAAELVASPDEVYASVNGKILDLQRSIRGLNEKEFELNHDLRAAVREHKDEWAGKYAEPAIAASHTRLLAAVDELRAAITEHQAHLNLRMWLRNLTDMRAGVRSLEAGQLDWQRGRSYGHDSVVVGTVLDKLVERAESLTAEAEAETAAAVR